MKKALFLAAAWLALVPAFGLASETAAARLYSLSLRFSPCHDDGDFYVLNLSSSSDTINGELGPYFYFVDANTTHAAYLELNDLLMDNTLYGGMDLTVPDGADANGNGFPDFYEVGQAVNVTSSGTYGVYGLGQDEPVSATWVRAAGSRFGTCNLIFRNTIFGNLYYRPTFEVMEYTGPLSFTPASNTVAGSLNLIQSDNPDSTLGGPIAFTKVSTNRFNVLTLNAGTWTNGVDQSFTYNSRTFYRDTVVKTNYYGYVLFNTPDYWIWELSIDDLNDTDHDSIPDFSDDPSGLVLPRRPQLTLSRGTTNLLLRISADIGRTNHIQELSSLSSTNWSTISTVTITNDPQTVSLPLPNSPRFWRVKVQ